MRNRGDRRFAGSNPGLQPTVEEPNRLDPGIKESPDQSRRRHDAIGFGSINPHFAIRADPESGERFLEAIRRQHISVGGTLVVRIILRLVRARFEIGRVDLDRPREMT